MFRNCCDFVYIFGKYECIQIVKKKIKFNLLTYLQAKQRGITKYQKQSSRAALKNIKFPGKYLWQDPFW